LIISNVTRHVTLVNAVNGDKKMHVAGREGRPTHAV